MLVALKEVTSALPAKHWRRAPFYAFMVAKVSNSIAGRPRHRKASFTGSVSVLCFHNMLTVTVTAALFRSLVVEAVFHEKGLAYDVCKG